MSDNRLDRAIDRAVRHMMNAEPRPGLRGRVLARLGERPSRALFWPSLGFAGAVAALLLAVFLFRPSPVVDPAPTEMARAEAPALPSGSPTPAPAEPAVEPAPRPPDAPASAPAATSRTTAPAAPARGPKSEELPPPPRMDDVFGTRSNRVSAADAGKAQPPAKTANLRLEFVFTLEGDGVEPARKTVTMVVADRQTGRHRSAEGDHVFIEVRPSLLADGRIQVVAKLEYRPRGSDTTGLGDSISTVLDDEQALVVSRASDARAKRQISVALTATTLK